MPRRRTQTPEGRRAITRAAQARYRARHRTELNAKRRERYWRDIEKTHAQQKRWNKTQWAKNKDKLKRGNSEYRAKNRPRLLEKMRQWRLANLDRVRAYDRERSRLGYALGKKLIYMREWRQRNLEKSRDYLRASFHKRRIAIGADSFSAQEWSALKKQFGNRCAYCGRPGPVTVDHRVPLSRGGRNVIANILPACKSCNSKKHDKTELEFRAQLRRVAMHEFSDLFVALRHGPSPWRSAA